MPGDGPDAGGKVDPLNRLVINARDSFLPVNAEGGTDPNCGSFSIRVVIDDDFAQEVNRDFTNFTGDGIFGGGNLPPLENLPPSQRIFSPTGRWFEAICDGAINVAPEGGPPISVDELVLDILDVLDPPPPPLAPAPEEAFLVQTPAWLAVEPAYWDEDRTETIGAGRVTVTGTLTPFQALWEMGDGEEVTCDDAGVVWARGMDPERPPDCHYIYETSSARSASGTYDLTSTVSFAVGVVSNAPGPFGPYPSVDRATTDAVEVQEIQALNR